MLSFLFFLRSSLPPGLSLWLPFQRYCLKNPCICTSTVLPGFHAFPLSTYIWPHALDFVSCIHCCLVGVPSQHSLPTAFLDLFLRLFLKLHLLLRSYKTQTPTKSKLTVVRQTCNGEYVRWNYCRNFGKKRCIYSTVQYEDLLLRAVMMSNANLAPQSKALAKYNNVLECFVLSCSSILF